MKILHVSAVRELSAGQRKQLQYEYTAARQLEPIICWDVVALQIKPAEETFITQYPRFFRSLFLRKFYVWLYILDKHSKYDIIIMRHMTFDPFVILFGWFIRNRISIHHAKEVQELKLIKRNWQGWVASLLERLTGYVSSRQVLAVLGVTKEIAEYEVREHNAKCPAGYYPNGIDLEQVDVLEDQRSKTHIQIAFMCGKFSSWHGLDRLMDAVRCHEEQNIFGYPVIIHIVGEMDRTQIELIQAMSLKNTVVESHGRMIYHEYRYILSRCDIGLDSLALDRKGLKEAAALKVREYLASGLPVYSGFSDTAIPSHFSYYRTGTVDMNPIIAFAKEMKTTQRQQVRDASADYIQKLDIMKNLLAWLSDNVLHGRK